MKTAIIVIIFISGLIIIYLKQKISDLEDELQYLARLLFKNSTDDELEHSYELKEDADGNIIDASGKKYVMVKIKVDKKK